MANTLASSKTPAILRSEIILKSSGFNGVFFAVEGDFDSMFWKTRIDRDKARIVQCGGKTNLLGLLDLYEPRNYDRLIAVADADFDRHLGSIRSIWCLSYTDRCDLETTLIGGDSFIRILGEYGDEIKIRTFEESRGVSVLEHLRVVSSCFGSLRFINAVRGYGIDFDKFLSPYKYVSVHDWSIDEPKLVQDFKNRAEISDAQLSLDQDVLLDAKVSDPWGLVQGHDCIKILAIGFGAAILGKGGQKSIDQAELQKALRLTFNMNELMLTRMYQDLMNAELRHGFPLFVSSSS